MATFNINTISGGLVELNLVNDRFHGQQLYLHIDQSTNVNNGEGDAFIVLSNIEVKALIGMLNNYLIYTEGETHVILASPIINDAVTIVVDEKKAPEEEQKLESPDLSGLSN